MKHSFIFKPFLFLFAVALMAVSCKEELNLGFSDDTDGGEKEITVQVIVPQNDQPLQLRSIGASQENAIETIDVLAFSIGSDGKEYYDYYAEGQLTGGTSGDNVRTIKLLARIKGNQQRFVLIANAGEEVKNLLASAIWKGAERDSMLSKVEFSLEKGNKWNAIDAQNYTAFPLWGESGTVTISPTTSQLENQLSLLRMVAKINVQLDSSVNGLASKFKLKSVRLYNTNNKGRIVPDKEFISSETKDGKLYLKVTGATVPADAEKQEGPLVYTDFTSPGEADKAIRGSIYTFETKAVEKENPLQATCLVIGGLYENDADTTYYRVDFLDNTKTAYADILRNHQYTVNIVDIKARGHEDPDVAFRSKSVNMLAEILNWDENGAGMHNIAFDGQYYLSVSQDEFNFSCEKYDHTSGTSNVLQIKTNFQYPGETSGWRVDKIVDTEDETQEVKWLTLSINQGAPDTLANVVLNLDENTASDAKIRKAKIIFAAGWLRYPVYVTQTLLPGVSITFSNASGVLTKNELIFSTPIGSSYTSQSFSVDWTPKEMDFVIYQSIITGIPSATFSFAPENFGIFTGGNNGKPLDYSVAPKSPLTNADIDKDPFYNRAVQLVFSVSNGLNTAEKSMILRQIYYNRLVEDLQPTYSLTGEHTFHIKSNSEWKVKSIEPSDILANNSSLLSRSGSGDTNTGEPFTFSFAAGVTTGDSVEITFTDPSGKIEASRDTKVTIRAGN
jgi:hypothetical protein